MLSLHWYFYTPSSNLKEEMCNVYAFVCGRSFIPHLTHLLLRYFDKKYIIWSPPACVEETKGSNILSIKSNFSTLSSDVPQAPLQWLWLDSWLRSASPRARCATTPSCSKVQARCVHEARRLLVLPEHLAKQRAILEKLRVEVKVEIEFLFLSLRVPLQAAMGIAELITMAMEKEGLPKDECIKKIWMVDSKGLIVKVSNCSANRIRPVRRM